MLVKVFVAIQSDDGFFSNTIMMVVSLATQ